jgi:hypothetical protein
MSMPRQQTNPFEDEIPSQPASPKSAVKNVLKWALTCLPLGGVAWASFLPLPTWMQQVLVLITLIWFFVFFLLDTFFLGG